MIRDRVRAAMRADLANTVIPGRMLSRLVDAGQVNRAVLTMLVAEAHAAAESPMLDRLAVMVELIHRASVIHDDIQDDDRLRRGRPTLHIAEGLPVAIGVADVLLSRAFVLARETGSPAVVADTLKTYADMAHGQLMDFVGLDAASAADWTLPSRLKTGALAELAFRYGAHAGGAGPGSVRAWGLVGQLCGSAFQLFNDLRNARAEENRGDVASDLDSGRFSAVRLYARHAFGADPHGDQERLTAACEAVEAEAHRRLAEAHELLDGIAPEGFGARVLSVLTTPAPGSEFTLRDPDGGGRSAT
ncbi:polyprenyl synthetase family protein [Actinoplanes derwentensis]|uniref:polyprenyl synthetase family protein n=1 Tax=Actinoplanes derwentensis TaxID=113562 RepID=UPI0012FE1414|nr:polyprenyl synthetase family protein [Actinoplanes derwentensis]GID82408.1 serralysin [Actinoplanes derwentensis]